ncbi:hypothetical protein [Fimbriimonas ginsengisoli]|uniref:Uncharacterized protein n=1 Tax=Fimbriimonas ginsengisoli Gsoil 348 TaxID=661478 RepID=A0A068NSS1_FIMGI|nr:hypothetical protein [Fimbriimonas ginsengisoli]AIE86407.1 hypothetical protein OP10G_3039 [Fimbriimonas ginsengisoli Gsoil 348]
MERRQAKVFAAFLGLIIGWGCGGGSSASGSAGGTGTGGPSGTPSHWSVTVLAPSGVNNSATYAVAPGYQAGSARLAGSNQSAVIWHGSAASVENFNPAGSDNSIIVAASSTDQGGTAVLGGIAHAALWHGTAASFVDLHPTGATYSTVKALYGNEQGGNIGPGEQAAMWSGSAATFRRLQPSGSTSSAVNGMGPGQQVGFFTAPSNAHGYAHACLWSGSAASVSDLNGVLDSSQAFATDGVHQVGLADVPGITGSHAAMWSGTASSFVDLNPAGAGSSEAHAVSGRFQAGFAYSGALAAAALWQGSARSWVNLHQFLPAGYKSSYAYSIVQTAGKVIVGGYAVDDAGTNAVAVIWVGR